MTNSITTEEEEKQLTFGDLKNGDIFCIPYTDYGNNTYYMKVTGWGGDLESNRIAVSAVSLSSGVVYSLADEVLVEPENKITIKKD